MVSPNISQRAPYGVEAEAGKSYRWYACGRSTRQPFCDGGHKDSTFVPAEYKADETKTVWFCGYKHTRTAPFCDSTHNTLPV